MSDQPTQPQLDRIKARVLHSLTLALESERIEYEALRVDIGIRLPLPVTEIVIDFKPNRSG